MGLLKRLTRLGCCHRFRLYKRPHAAQAVSRDNVDLICNRYLQTAESFLCKLLQVEGRQPARDDDRIIFMFIGGGKGKAAVEKFIAEEKPPNILSLPYQPLDRIKYSLSAADVHLISMREAMGGCVHPCKFYGAMALGKPIIALGPSRSHVGEILEQNKVGWRIDHGDVDGAVHVMRQCLSAGDSELVELGSEGRRLVEEQLSKDILCGRFCDIVEQTSGLA